MDHHDDEERTLEPLADHLPGDVLLVEDDEAMAEMVGMTLTAAGLAVRTAGSGNDARTLVEQIEPDVVVLDLGLPDVDGVELCRELRSQRRTPIVMLTARTGTRDIVVGLEAGADDYITKPFVVPELLARVRAALRRALADDDDVIAVGGLRIDPGAFQVERDGEPVHLSATEFRLLHELALRRGKVCTREMLLRRVWDHDHLGDSRLIDMAVKRLRDRVEVDPADPTLVVTVRGVGYRLDAIR